MTLDALSPLLPGLRLDLLRYAFCHAPAGSAEDLVQETLIQLVQLAGRIDERGPKGFALHILKWAISHARRGLRVTHVPLEDARTGAPVEIPVAAGQETHAEARDALRLIEGLDEERRSLFCEVSVLGGTLEEAAASRNVPVGTVKSRLHRTTRELRAALEGGRSSRSRRKAA